MQVAALDVSSDRCVGRAMCTCVHLVSRVAPPVNQACMWLALMAWKIWPHLASQARNHKGKAQGVCVCVCVGKEGCIAV